MGKAKLVAYRLMCIAPYIVFNIVYVFSPIPRMVNLLLVVGLVVLLYRTHTKSGSRTVGIDIVDRRLCLCIEV